MKFDYKEIDEEGLETLEAITEAHQFNKWMFDTIRPYCQGKILEVGSGIGNISRYFIEEGADITLSDLRSNYLKALNEQFSSTRQVCMDLVHPDFDHKYADYIGQYDAVFALNVVEHIEDHVQAMKNINKLLKSGGKATILVPAFQSLYNKLDKELYHFRRYTSKTLKEIFVDANFRLEKSFYFNTMGIPAWFIGGKLMGDSTVKKSKMSLYNKLVPVFKLIDIPFKGFLGLSVITVGTK